MMNLKPGDIYKIGYKETILDSTSSEEFYTCVFICYLLGKKPHKSTLDKDLAMYKKFEFISRKMIL